MRIISLAVLTFLSVTFRVLSGEIAQHDTAYYADHTKALTYTNAAGDSMAYRLFLPRDYDAGKRYPLVLVFHGAGQRGDDNRKQLAPYAAGWIDAAVQSRHPCIILLPQCPTGQQWVDTPWAKGSYSLAAVPISAPMKLAKEIFDQVLREESVDKSRVYVMGASMGGYGAWNFVMRYPELVAAAIPVCGAGDPAMAEAIKQIPIWAFHGDVDDIVPPSGSREMVDAITKVGGTRIKLTMYPGVAHGSFMKAWRDPDLVEWVFSQSKWSTSVAAAAAEGAKWPVADATCKPWAYNWWLGSAVDKENLTKEFERYRDAGLGGIHIVPIYGVKGAEARSIKYLSPQWMEMLAFAVREGKRLGLGVDMTTGTGWCFGGPNVTPDMSCLGIKISETGVEVHPKGTMVKRAAPGGEGLMINPFYGEAMRQYLPRFTAAFAEQPSDARPRAMYHDSYEYFGAQWSPDLLEEFAKRRGYPLQDQWPLFAGKGDRDAVARVRADYKETVSDLMVDKVFPQWVQWSHDHGMLTRDQAHGSPANLLDLYALSDIPETEMFGRGRRDPLKSGFDERFGEGDRDPLISKFASSAAHLAGKKRTSAEYGTWMSEHFCETLEELKCFADLLFVSGINHVFYHGCVYSLDDAAWPGWLFYASTQMNPRNSIWHDAPTLNAYIARCQSVLQAGAPDNEVLLYWPIHDRWHGTQSLPEMFSVHNRAWLVSEPVGRLARQLWNQGIGFDYVSDRLLQRAVMTGAGEVSFGESRYRAIVVPSATRLPVETMEILQKLARHGAKVLFVDHFPLDVPGYGNLETRRAALAKLLADKGAFRVGALTPLLAEAGITGEGVAQHPGTLMVRRRMDDGRYLFIANQSIKPLTGWFSLATPARSASIMDPMTGQTGMAALRKAEGDASKADVYLHLEPGHSLILRTFADREIAGEPWIWPVAKEALLEIKGSWQITFKEGGPVLPKAYEAMQLGSWTTNGDPETERFAGTAVYRKVFDLTGEFRIQNSEDSRTMQRQMTKSLWLDLGSVKQSARVSLNGQSLGTLIMAPYRVMIPQGLLKATGNELLVEVTNLSANRIRDLDLRKVSWRIFKEINFVNYNYNPFDASKWPVFESGLLGPVRVMKTMSQ